MKICGSERDKNQWQTDTAEEVGLDQTHPQEASIQHHTPSPDLEPAGEEEERPANSWRRDTEAELKQKGTKCPE